MSAAPRQWLDMIDMAIDTSSNQFIFADRTPAFLLLKQRVDVFFYNWLALSAARYCSLTPRPFA